MTRPAGGLALAVLVVVGCVDAGPISRISPRLGPGDASAPDASLCARIPALGCCDGEALWWCESGQPRSRNCARDAPRCGWSNSGYYDCNTSGSQDPSGANGRECGELGLPARDAAVPDGALTSCGAVTHRGCCEGNVLKYCDQGTLRVLPCVLNPSCGWLPNGQLYDCGTEGASDPSGGLARACPAPHLDASFEVASDFGDLIRPRADLGGDAPRGDGCSCGLVRPRAAHATPLLLLALAALARRGRLRRRRRAPTAACGDRRSARGRARARGSCPCRRSRDAARRG
jgi:hypothetical protein